MKALVVLDHARFGSGRTLGETKGILQRLVFITTQSGQTVLATLEAAPVESMDGLEEAKELLEMQFEEITGLDLRRYPKLLQP